MHRSCLLLLIALLLAGCGPKETPLPVRASLPVVAHAWSVAMADLVWARPGPARPTSSRFELRDDLLEELRDPEEKRLRHLAERLEQGLLGYAALEVTPDEISVGGQTVLYLSRGLVSEEYRRGSLISPLYDTLKDAADEEKALAQVTGARFEGRLLLLIDGKAPWPTVLQVLYTAGQAQFSDFLVGVHDPGAPDLAGAPGPVSQDRAITVAHGPGADVTVSAISDAVVSGSLAELGRLAGQLIGPDAAIGCATVVPSDGNDWSQVVPTFDRLTELGARHITITGGAASLPVTGAPSAPLAPAAPWLRLEDRVSVIRLALPRIGPPRPSTDPPPGDCSSPGLFTPPPLDLGELGDLRRLRTGQSGDVGLGR